MQNSTVCCTDESCSDVDAYISNPSVAGYQDVLFYLYEYGEFNCLFISY